MLGQIAVNLILALIWTFLHTPLTFQDFLVGWLLGLFIVFIVNRQSPGDFYLRRLWNLFFLVLIFFREILKSCMVVMRLVFAPRAKPRSGIITYETALTTPWHVVLLANMITIIPGSVVLEISPDNRIFYIHILDFSDADEVRRDIRNTLEANIRRAIR
jgi:multicomponent Na+:H+ antiporter subunit E